MSGRGFVKLAPHVRLIEHQACSYCKQLGPACQCGRPTWMNERREPHPRTSNEGGSA